MRLHGKPWTVLWKHRLQISYGFFRSEILRVRLRPWRAGKTYIGKEHSKSREVWEQRREKNTAWVWLQLLRAWEKRLENKAGKRRWWQALNSHKDNSTCSQKNDSGSVDDVNQKLEQGRTRSSPWNPGNQQSKGINQTKTLSLIDSPYPDQSSALVLSARTASLRSNILPLFTCCFHVCPCSFSFACSFPKSGL